MSPIIWLLNDARPDPNAKLKSAWAQFRILKRAKERIWRIHSDAVNGSRFRWSKYLPAIDSLTSMEKQYHRERVKRLIEISLVVIGSPFVLGWIIYHWQFDPWVSSGKMTADHFARVCDAVGLLIGSAAYFLIDTLLDKGWRARPVEEND
jgi:hypothetical protein